MTTATTDLYDPRADCWGFIERAYGPQEPQGETRDAFGYVVPTLRLIGEWEQACEGERLTLCLPLGPAGPGEGTF